MFGKKRIKELEQQLKEEQDRNNKLNEILRLLNVNNNHIALLSKKLLPAQSIIKHTTVDAIEFAQTLQKFPSGRGCIRGVCGLHYKIPCHIVDSMATSKSLAEKTETNPSQSEIQSIKSQD